MARTINALINLMNPEIRDIFLEVIQNIVDEALYNDIVEAIANNDPEAAFRAAGFTAAALSPLIDSIDRTFRDAGNITVQGFPNPINTPAGRVVFRFDMRNPRAEDYLRNHSSELVTRLTTEARENIRITMERGLIAGNNPKATALDIVGRIDPVTKQRTGGVLGLSNAQEKWITSVRNNLNDLNNDYFNKTLRDRRFDSLVKKAIETGQPLTKDTIDKLVNAYKNKALKYRADAISRTEVIHAVNRAEWQAHMQAIDEGALKASQVRKYWDSVGDNHVRHTHAAMDKKYHKDGVGIDEPFVSPSGASLMFPGDTSLGAGADEVVMCRCRYKMVVDWFADL